MIFSLFFRWFFCINIFLDICGRKRNYVVFFLISLNTNKPKHWILFRLGLVVGSWGSSIWTDGCCTMFKYDSHFCRLSWVPRYSEVLMKRGHCMSGSVYIYLSCKGREVIHPSCPQCLATCELWLSSASFAHVSGCWIQPKHSISEQNASAKTVMNWSCFIIYSYIVEMSYCFACLDWVVLSCKWTHDCPVHTNFEAS